MKKILLSYLKKQIILFSILIISNILLIFSTIFLYDVETEAVLYPIFIEVLILILYFLYDFSIFSRKYQNLEILKNNLYTELKKIDKSENIVENKYIDVINKLIEENKKIIEKNRQETKEIIDYYTMWVHQIKTPIAALSFLIENSEDENKKQEEIELFKIEQYVNMVNSYLRLDNNKNDLVIEKIKISEAINNVLKKYAILFFSKNLNIEYTQIDLSIISDQKWLEFILEQIINNAIKYSKKQGVIKIYRKENSLIIEDTGIGISADNLPRIFDKGYTGFNGRKEKKSSGLGLYLTKKTVDKLGFLIDIDSEINKGTRVKISFDKDIIL
ncbi:MULTISPECIES: sensor histidine kinase [unclassified Gemella]|uniref:sensor histidine kinase n=1 Tax=unclassified Gemella TaxID=2624949 RepID=UPI001C04181D|nr:MULTISPECIES: sensor histidine kinase [unclassified Gemella]MBU0279047.1 sensor histidine kinase [Gemella sp. zg-1178]QWQ38786.1 sensor histidine kinase [Gemella sp. zg-570]